MKYDFLFIESIKQIFYLKIILLENKKALYL